MDLTDYRAQIDAVDSELVRAFAARMEIAAQIAAYKRAHGLPVLQPAREEEKLNALSEAAPEALRPYLTQLYRTIFALSRAYQEAQ